MMLVQPDPCQSYPSQPSPPHLRIGKKEGLKRGARGVAGNKTSPFGVNRFGAFSSTAQTGPSPRSAVAMRYGLGLQERGSYLVMRCSQYGRGISSARKIKQKIDPSEMPGVLRWPLCISVTDSCEFVFESDPQVRPNILKRRVAKHILQFGLRAFVRRVHHSNSGSFRHDDIG